MSKIEDRFPNNGRQLFEHEKPIVEAFKEKYKDRLKAPPRKTPFRVHIPSWMYDSGDNIVKRVYDVENLLSSLCFVQVSLRVSVSKQMFEKIISDEYVKGIYMYYAKNPQVAELVSVENLEGKRWIVICKTLFVEE